MKLQFVDGQALVCAKISGADWKSACVSSIEVLSAFRPHEELLASAQSRWESIRFALTGRAMYVTELGFIASMARAEDMAAAAESGLRGARGVASPLHRMLPRHWRREDMALDAPSALALAALCSQVYEDFGAQV